MKLAVKPSKEGKRVTKELNTAINNVSMATLQKVQEKEKELKEMKVGIGSILNGLFT